MASPRCARAAAYCLWHSCQFETAPPRQDSGLTLPEALAKLRARLAQTLWFRHVGSRDTVAHYRQKVANFMPEVQERTQYRYFVVCFLAIVYTFNFMDRQIMSVLQEPIRREMGLSDTQLGMLTGLRCQAAYGSTPG